MAKITSRRLLMSKPLYTADISAIVPNLQALKKELEEKRQLAAEADVRIRELEQTIVAIKKAILEIDQLESIQRERPINEFQVSNAIKASLRRMRIHTVEGLVEMKASQLEKDLHGPKGAVEEIQRVLKNDYGLTLAAETEE